MCLKRIQNNILKKRRAFFLKYHEKMEQQLPESKAKLLCILLCVSFL